MDIDWDGGLPCHIVLSATAVDGRAAIDPALLNDPVAARVLSLNNDPNLVAFARQLTSANIKLLDPNGEPQERKAIDFHAGTLLPSTTVTTHPRQHGFTIFGHDWFHEPWMSNSTVLWKAGAAEPDSMTIGTARWSYGASPLEHHSAKRRRSVQSSWRLSVSHAGEFSIRWRIMGHLPCNAMALGANVV